MLKHFASRLPFVLGLLLIMAMSTGCKTRRVLEKSALIPLSDNALLSLVQANTFDFATLNGKMSASIVSDVHNGSFKINLRMTADSIIWLSVTPALGIEAARAVMEPDSLKFIDKLKNNYYLGSFEVLDSLINYYAEFELIQNLLTGNPIQIDSDEKYTAGTEGLRYVLSTKVKRKVRKSLNKTDFEQDTADFDVVKERKFEKAKEKFDDQDLIIKRYFVRPDDFKVVLTQIDDILYKRTLRVYYKDFEDIDGQSFPMNISIEVSSPDQSAKFDLSYSRIRINEPQTYPFKIPAKYTPIR